MAGDIEAMRSTLLSYVSFGHVVDHMTRSKFTFHEHNGSIESIMIETRKHNGMIFRA